MSVEYDVATLLREPVGSTREYDVDDEMAVMGDEALCRVAGHATFLRTEAGLLVTAHLRGSQPDACSRCLQDIDVPVTVDFEEEFFPTVDANTGFTLPPPADPDSFRIDAHQVLELDDAVRQTWAGAMPMQPLCRPECRGLCPRCGRDLNQGACSCKPEEDPRWSVLQQLVQERK